MSKRTIFWVLTIVGIGLISGVMIVRSGTSSPRASVRAGAPASSAATTPLETQAGPTPSGAAIAVVTLPIPSTPSGALGTPTNPFGSPAVAFSSCPATSTTPVSSISISFTSAGFMQSCYQVPEEQAISAVMTDGIINPTTNLVVSAEVTISTLSAPVVAQAATASGATMPNVTMATATPLPQVDLRNALYTSPTAPDSNSIDFTIPPLAAGEYLIQIPTLATVPSAILTVGGAAPTTASTTSSLAPSSTTTTVATSTQVLVTPSSPADDNGIQAAFQSWEQLPPTCEAEIVPGSDKFATDTQTGIRWSIAQFQPGTACSETLAPAYPGGPSRIASANQIGPFGRSTPPVGVFQQLAGGTWTMDEEGGTPFPCPAPGGLVPGPGNGAVPAPVLAAWSLSYAPNCAFVFYPPKPI